MISLVYCVNYLAGFDIVANLDNLEAGILYCTVQAVIRPESGSKYDGVTADLFLFSTDFHYDAVVQNLRELCTGHNIYAGMLHQVSNVLVVCYKVIGGKQNLRKDFNHCDILALHIKLGGKFAANLSAAYNYNSLTDRPLLEQNRNRRAHIWLFITGNGDHNRVCASSNNHEIGIVFLDILQSCGLTQTYIYLVLYT